MATRAKDVTDAVVTHIRNTPRTVFILYGQMRRKPFFRITETAALGYFILEKERLGKE